jgi:ADP-heptose:LPS heptosyltransferase
MMKWLKARDTRETGLDNFDPELISCILVISSTAIGDTLMSTPGLRAIRERFPKARIVGLFNAKYTELFANNPHLDEVVPIHRGYLGFVRTVLKLRRFKPELGIIFHGNDPHAVPTAYLSGARFIVQVHPSKTYGFLLSGHDGRGTEPRPPHAIEQRLRTASLVGGAEDDKRMVLVVEEEEVRSVTAFLEKRGIPGTHRLVGLQSGAKDRYKMWPAEKFAELGRGLAEAYPEVRLILIGSKPEAGYCQSIADRIGGRALSVAGEITLKELRGLISKMALLVTNDTGAMHMAIALGTKTVTVFGPTNHLGVGVIQDLHLHRIVKTERPCQPCVTKKCRDPFCMEAIEVADVFKAAREALD